MAHAAAGLHTLAFLSAINLVLNDWRAMHNGRHVDGWLDHAEEQFKTYPLWKGVLAWVLLALVVALILG
jgi:hypothetical protein